MSNLWLGEVDTGSFLGLTVGLESDGLRGNETSGVGRSKVVNGVHAAELGVVQLAGLRAATKDGNGALEASDADLTVNVVLTSGDGLLDELALWGEV